jgi:hypothetical protein
MGGVEINYLAVLVAGLVSFIVGSLWYGPLFGKSWMEAVGKTEDDLKKGFNPAKTYGLAFIAHVAVAFTLAYFISLTGADSMKDGFRVGITAWFGFSAATMYINFLFEGYKTKLFFINVGYYLTFFVVATLILMLWK